MFRIELYECPLGPAQTQCLVKNNVTEMEERPDAVAYIEAHIARYDHGGHDDREDFWWCRNEGDEVVKIMVIRAN
jgi:hypothetical protein